MRYYVYIEYKGNEDYAIGFLCDNIICSEDKITCLGVYLLDEKVKRKEIDTKYIKEMTVTARCYN